MTTENPQCVRNAVQFFNSLTRSEGKCIKTNRTKSNVVKNSEVNASVKVKEVSSSGSLLAKENLSLLEDINKTTAFNVAALDELNTITNITRVTINRSLESDDYQLTDFPNYSIVSPLNQKLCEMPVMPVIKPKLKLPKNTPQKSTTMITDYAISSTHNRKQQSHNIIDKNNFKTVIHLNAENASNKVQTKNVKNIALKWENNVTLNPLYSESKKPKVPPKIPPKNFARQRSKPKLVEVVTPKINSFDDSDECPSPAVESQQIIENFNRHISPYNTFRVPKSAIPTDIVRQTLEIVSKIPPSPRKEKQEVGKTQIMTNRSDAFLEPYFQGFGGSQSPVGVPSSPPPCRIAPILLPTPASRSPSRESLVSSNGGSDGGSEDSGDTGYGATCDIGLMERLSRSHQIWFLPGIQRAGAFHLLQGKEEGCFVVRQSSQPDTMALSVRLPPDKGPYIEHYLILSCDGKLALETSENRFDSIPALIAHYASCCDELPVQLTLPKAIREAKSRQKLSSLALLGQEFWTYSSPPPSNASSPDADLVLNLNPLSTFKSAEPAAPIVSKDKPMRPNTLNLLNKIDPNRGDKLDNERSMLPLKGDFAAKNPPPPPPRWSKPSTPQNNITVTTTVTFSVNSQQSPQMEEYCDKRLSPETQSVSSSKESSRRTQEQILSPNSSILSPGSDPSSILSPDTLSPLSITKGARHSKRSKHKVSKHYQESDIVDSPTMLYYKSGLGDKISDYEDIWANEPVTKSKTTNLASPDLLQHTGNVVSLNNNILSPTDSQNGSSTKSHCSTSSLQQTHCNKGLIQSPIPHTETCSTPSASESTNIHPTKQSSPFYAEPADSLTPSAHIFQVPRRIPSKNVYPINQRHSNPPALHSLSPLSPALERIESSEMTGMSSSVDNLSPKQKFLALRKPELKVVMPPSIKHRSNDNWQVDYDWKFTRDCDGNMESSDPEYESDWPTIPANIPTVPDMFTSDPDDRITVQEMISKRFPDIRASLELKSEEMISRMSAYDNVEDKRIPKAPPSEISEVTEFSDPWTEVSPGISTNETDSSLTDSTPQPPKVASINRSKSFKDRLDPLLSAPRLQALRSKDVNGQTCVGTSIKKYSLELAQDKSTTFAQNIDNFIACTRESKETNPQVVMRNMRQFMSGMKNYLVKHGEKGFYKEIEKERNKLKSTEFLNLDAILESVMHKLVVRPLKLHLQTLFLDHYTKTGAIRLLADNIQYASNRPVTELAIKASIHLPSESALNAIAQYFQKLQAADSPLEKLECLLAAIATIFNSVKTGQLTGSGRPIPLGADDFLPLFVWVLVKTHFVAAEIEAEYMWGLLHPSLLSGEGGYYLTTLSSAIHVLKNFKESSEENTKQQVKNESVLKVVVPDELHGSILTKTLPARPHMTTKEVCKIIAHKARITNPQDYALYRLTDGEEAMLLDNECPQDYIHEGRHTMLAYKRIEAKIAWPKITN